MSPGYGMYQQQAAKMHLTPHMRQAIKILRLSTPELAEYVRQELEANPVLEYADNGREPNIAPPKGEKASGRHRHPDYDPLRRAVADDLTLETYLVRQLNLTSHIPQSIRKIVAYIAGNLDGNGYLACSLEEIAESLQAGAEQAEAALRILQRFDPAGAGARSLKECLRLQAERLAECPPLVHKLIADHLDDVAANRIRALSKALQASPQEIGAAIRILQSFNPRPGAVFQRGGNAYVVPDAIVERAGEAFAVTIRDAAAPRLTTNECYERMAQESGENRDVQTFISDKLHSARFLIKCIEQRRMTLLRVTRAIVEEQTDFFRQGKPYLKPLTLKQIADNVGLHESTVSRAVSGKYAQTPWGTFELAYFFPSGLQSDRGDPASSESVKERIKAWIGSENRGKPYSDRQLARLLNEEGIPVSRRTVAKYREELGIASSVRRKRL